MYLIKAAKGCECEFSLPSGSICKDLAVVCDEDVENLDLGHPKWFCHIHRPDREKQPA